MAGYPPDALGVSGPSSTSDNAVTLSPSRLAVSPNSRLPFALSVVSGVKRCGASLAIQAGSGGGGGAGETIMATAAKLSCHKATAAATLDSPSAPFAAMPP